MDGRRPIVVAGLGFGDEGKGTITDALARRLGASAVVRYNGGPQAGHNVLLPDGRWHCFAQFGAGTFVPGARTILSRHMLVNLRNLENEEQALRDKGVDDAWARLTIDPMCAVVTVPQILVGRMREVARSAGRHGSCGQGVGETVRDAETGLAVTVADLLDGRGGYKKLQRLFDAKRAEATDLLRDGTSDVLRALYDELANGSDAEALAYRHRFMLDEARFSVADATSALHDAMGRGHVIFEGAQGALLDRERGFSPYVTKTCSTAQNARTLLAETGVGERPYVLGALRAYGHRHGTGPFVTEDETLRDRFDDPYNAENGWQGRFRVGWLDLVALRYGLALQGGVDGLAITSLDRLTGLGRVRVCASYVYDGPLEALDSYCRWEPRSVGGARIIALKADGPVPAAGALAKILSRCEPLEYHELGGWTDDVRRARSFDDLPRQAKSLVRFLGGGNGLGAPIKIVSVGPASDQKLFL